MIAVYYNADSSPFTLNVSIPTVLNKIKLLLNVNGLTEARKLLNNETVSLHRND